MSFVTSAAYTIGVTQSDGRWVVTETHITDDQRTFTYEYLCDASLSEQLVLEARVVVINQILAARALAIAAVVGTGVPYTKHEFLSRFTAAERIAIRDFAKSGHPYATAVNDFMEMLNASGGVYIALARPGINFLSALGLITSDRVTVIGAD